MSEYDPMRQMILTVSAEMEHKEFAPDGEQLANGSCEDPELHDPHVWRDRLNYPLLCRGGKPSLEQVETYLGGQ